MTKPLPYRLRLTDRVELCDAEGRIVPLRTRKVALLLAILASEGGAWRRRDELGARVWEGDDPEAVGVRLRNALSAARKALGSEAIRASGDSIGLDPMSVIVEEGYGEFMPGFDEEWVIDRRLRLRAQAVAHALDEARAAESAGRSDEALSHAERACAIDPLNVEAKRMRGHLLAQAGRLGEAVETDLTFRVRVVRELGFVPPSDAPEPARPDNPLLKTFEWTLERDPDEACALLAATPNQWFWIDAGTALSAHERVLSATSLPSYERTAVEAAASFLEIVSGRFDRLDVAAERYRAAREMGEFNVAGLLCYPLASGYAELGELERAARYWEKALQSARRPDNHLSIRTRVAYAEAAFGVFEQSLGKHESGADRVEAATRLMEQDGAPLRVWPIRRSQAASWIEKGLFDRAAEQLELCHRAAVAYGGDRIVPWILSSQARLHERMGDLPAARETFMRLRELAPAAGAELATTADEGLMRVHCGLREYGEAAEAWARVVRTRRRTGTVLMPHQRQLARPTLRRLRERLTTEDLQTALRRAIAR